MSNRQASRTALATAYMRAAHQILDAKPLVLEDTVAVQLLGKDAPQRGKRYPLNMLPYQFPNTWGKANQF